MNYKLALVSVSNKTGLAEVLRPLVQQGLQVISTGGTAKYLREHEIPVTYIQDFTGFPEVMDGRVRTLHPFVHMALLARENNSEDAAVLQQFKVNPIDLVIGNLYPFEQSLRDSDDHLEHIENIDIGGPALLRASAKNYKRIAVFCDPSDYCLLRADNNLSDSDRQKLAAKVFSHVSAYDSMVAQYLTSEPGGRFAIGGEQITQLRYGENPQQQGYWYRQLGADNGLHKAEIIQGKPLSFNNILDLDAATRLLREFDVPAAVAVKHNNPCGAAIGESALTALEKALQADPVSVFGGIVAVNREIDEQMALKLADIFLECIVAPKISIEAMSVFRKKKNLRILQWPDFQTAVNTIDFRSVQGGLLVQTADQLESWSQAWPVHGQQPNLAQQKDLSFAWKVCARLKSNAIAIVRDGQTIGLGMGQVNRVDAVQQAIDRALNFHKNLQNAVLASDAFFPFADSVEKAAAHGIAWIIQPGGSVRDDEVFAAAQAKNINMVVTGTRHFLH